MIRAPRNGPRAAKPLLAGGLRRRGRGNRLFAFRRSYHYIERAGQHFQRFRLEREHLSVDHDVDGILQVEFDARSRAPRSHRMPDVRRR